MYIEDLNIIRPSASGPYTTIQAAINAALINTPPESVVIPASYAGTDTYTNPSNVPVLDLRPTALNTGSNLGKSVVGGIPNGTQVVAGAAAPITAAAAANVFVTTLNLPTSTPVSYNGVPFVVKASGYISAAAGTYTVTVQPLIYASKTAGYTASAAAAVYSAAAYSLTVAAAAAVLSNWQAEVHLEGDSTSNVFNGWYLGSNNNGVINLVDLASIGANGAANIASPNFGAAVPVQFLAGVTTVGAGFPATSVVALSNFFLEV